MKKLILSLTILASTLFIFGQTLSLSDPNGALNHGDTIHVYVANDVAVEEHVFVTNTTLSAMDVKVRKHTIQLLTGAFNTFCWGQCFGPHVEESPYPITIAAETTNSTDFYADYNANGENGLTIVRYTFFDANNITDTADVYFFFHSTNASVKENVALKTEISNPYPNPAVNKCQFSYSVPFDSYDSKIVIMDLTGNIVQNISLIPGEGKVTVDVSSMSSGIYFYSLWVYDKAVSTRKLIVQK